MRRRLTYAQQSITDGRDDEHMIFEMFNLSQYEDGSVLDCRAMQAFTAQQVAEGAAHGRCACSAPTASKANAALKNGEKTNLEPMA